MLWQGALILALIDPGFAPLLVWQIKPANLPPTQMDARNDVSRLLGHSVGLDGD